MREEFEYRVTSPGRVNLIGEHTDYTLGYVMPLATDLHNRLDATPVESAVAVHSTALEETRSFAIGDVSPGGSWIDYVKGCYAVLQAEGHDPPGFDGRITNTLPLGSGLSSSASLELAVMTLLNEVNDLGYSRAELARLSQRVETDFVGVSCGIMDQFAVALGTEHNALLVDTETLEYDLVPLPENVRIVVFHIGVDRELVESAYNERRETAESALGTIGESSSKDVSTEKLAKLSGLEKQRLGYIVRENDRVILARNHLQSGDLSRVGELLLDAHSDIATNYEASCAELDSVVDLAVEHGAYGARLTGAGWGGTAIALVDAADARSFAESVYDAYTDMYPDHDAHYHLVSPADGVRIRSTE